MALKAIVSVLSLASAVAAWDAPEYAGFRKVWQENFSGGGGQTPNENNWAILTGDLNVNNELQVYTRDSRNLQLSGGSTLQVTPWRDGRFPKGWSSGRVETKQSFTPRAGALTRGEAVIMFGDVGAGGKQGIWPAFWSLGDSIRRGTGWPQCGEIDIMEHINGQNRVFGTLHCGVYPGGTCNEGYGISADTTLSNYQWKTYRIEWDRRPANWRDQSINWYLDGQRFHQVTGNRINDEKIWRQVAQSPIFYLLNVAVGGILPGNPNGATQDGWGVRMEVGYVAHYET